MSPGVRAARAMTKWRTGKVWNELHRGLVESLRQAAAEGVGDSGAQAISEAVERLSALTGECRHYLARSFDEQEKRGCARFHYSWLLEALGPAPVCALIGGSPEIWRLERDGASYTVKIRFEHWVPREGELTLEMHRDEDLLCLLSFSVAPGRLLGLEAREAVLVCRLQGNPGEFEQIRLATKAMDEVSPRAILFAAVAGLAKAAGMDHVVGVAGANHISLLPDNRETLQRQYDDFFLALDATPLSGGFYAVDLRAPAKPLTLQKTGHRVRTRRKRLLKQQIAESVAQTWTSMFPLQSPADRPAQNFESV